MKRVKRLFVLLLAIMCLVCAVSVSNVVCAAVNDQGIEPRAEVVKCDCGGSLRYVGNVEISLVTFRKLRCDSCGETICVPTSSCQCGDRLVAKGKETVGGVTYETYYCEECGTWFYCDLS